MSEALRLVHPPPDEEDPEDGLAILPARKASTEVAVQEPAELATIDGEATEERTDHPLFVASQRLHPRLRQVATSHTAEHAVIALVGLASWGRHAWDGASHGTYRRQIRAAEGVGDTAAVMEWTARHQQAVKDRHARWLQAPKLVGGLIAATCMVIAFVVALVLVGGLALAMVSAVTVGGAMGLTATVFTVLLWTGAAMAALSVPAGFGLLLWGAHREGRRQGATPSWLATASDADVDVTIDETTIARALEALRIPQITAYFKKGVPLQFVVTARQEGRGTYAAIRLPAGVTAEEIVTRRAKLASGLYRAAKETWPSTGGEAGILNLWIADKGALEEGAGPYPLLEDGAVDVFRGVPFGKTLRGDAIVAPVMERNTIVGGVPGQGKSNAARVIMAGAALDPTAELRIYVPDFNFDFEAFKPRCSRYVMGADEEDIGQIVDDLQELYAEVQRRGQLLIAHEVQAASRRIASAGVGLHPLFVLLEEAHLLFQHREWGEEAQRLVVDIVKLGRKRGIHVIVSTQAPTKTSIPRDVTRNCSNGIAFHVGDWVANNALLGEGAYAAGYRATELIPGVDRGTAVCKGFSGERGAIVQVHRLDVEKGNDQVTPIIARSVAAIERAGRTMPRALPAERRDLLADVATVLGEQEMPVAKVPALLMRLAPAYAPYKHLTGVQLRERLAEEYGVKVPSTGNRWPVSPEAVRAAQARVEAAEEG
jgi:S-DNA-T family DNA segregation ATPase FtsK/SpoIIIE